MRHIDLDTEHADVKQFVLSLPLDQEGSLLEVNGKPVARIVPVAGVNREKLRRAILARRDESRALNDEWEHVDRETWNADRE